MSASSASRHDKTDVAIAGASFAGLSLALALVRSLGPGLDVVVLDRATGAAGAGGEGDPRAVAITASSRHLLQAIGIWPTVEREAQPVTRIEITDSGLDAGIRPVLLKWDNFVDAKTGTAAHILPLPVLAKALLDAVAQEPQIRLVRPVDAVDLEADGFSARIKLADGHTIAAKLAVAAEGRASALREAAGIKLVGWPYKQSAISATIRHEKPHYGVAVQHFLPAGPFAILPLTGNRSCITWTEDEGQARRIMALDDAGFLDEVDRRFGGKLGPLSLEGERRSWPLIVHLARSYVAKRFALVGDAAHAVHPIAGQGLNLAMRDVAALTEVVADAARAGLDIGDATSLDRYERWRRFDSAAAAASFDALNRLFSRDAVLLRSVRELGLQVLDRVPFVKNTLIGEAAGLTGELPRLLKGELA